MNLVLDKPAVTELIQHDLTHQKLRAEVEKLLHDEAVRQRISDDYRELLGRLGGRGASVRAAEIVVDCAKNGTTNIIKEA